MIYAAALLLGFVSGLRALTGVAVLMLQRGGAAGIVAAVAAVGEYAADLMPAIPPRTKLPSIVLRPLCGFFAGWYYAAIHGANGLIGGLGGLIGALAGTFGGHAARLWLIERIGAVPAGLLEDLVALVLAIVVVFG